MLRWCLDAAKESGLKAADYMGGFVMDEMKIQVPLEYILKINHKNFVLMKIKKPILKGLVILKRYKDKEENALSSQHLRNDSCSIVKTEIFMLSIFS